MTPLAIVGTRGLLVVVLKISSVVKMGLKGVPEMSWEGGGPDLLAQMPGAWNGMNK